jgi:RNA polymerase subunit RPABC4/transcription elongation factor Spt4
MKHLLLLLTIITLSISSYASTPCKGTTKAGVACKSIIVDSKTGYCNAHNPNRVHCSGKTKAGKNCMMVVLKGSTVCRLHGK